MIGEVLGHWRIVAKIGEGGMGVVYRARDEILHRDVALKVVGKEVGLDPSASNSLLQEARASSSLAHPNICTVHEVGEANGKLYIVMELVEGKSLRDLSADGGIPAESALRYGIQIARALARAHDRNIIHRDLKSANIVVTADGGPSPAASTFRLLTESTVRRALPRCAHASAVRIAFRLTSVSSAAATMCCAPVPIST